jgi:hypothetical protein
LLVLEVGGSGPGKDWGMYFSAAASSENDQGSINLASKTAPLPWSRPSRVAAITERLGA